MNDLPTERLPTTAILRCFGDVGIFDDGCFFALGAEGLGGKDMLSRRDSIITTTVVTWLQVPKQNNANLIVDLRFVAVPGK